MAESEFSWLKLASFLGVCFLIVLAFVVVAQGINTFASSVFYGTADILCGIVCIISLVVVYKNYQKKSLYDRNHSSL